MLVKYYDLTNKKIGKLTVIKLTDKIHKNGTTRLWECKCDCGNTTYKICSKLLEAQREGYNLSCGCSKRKENLIGKTFNDYLVVGFVKDLENCDTLWKCKCIKCNREFEARTKQLRTNRNICKIEEKKQIKIEKDLHSCFARIKRRCYNSTCSEYKYYGGKGVRVCKEWLENSNNFVKWSLENGYENKKTAKGYNILTIDRIDSNGNYEPSNCRWVDMYVQSNNKCRNIFFTFQGKTQTLAQWCRELNLDYKYVHYLIKNKKLPFEKAIIYKKRKQKKRFLLVYFTCQTISINSFLQSQVSIKIPSSQLVRCPDTLIINLPLGFLSINSSIV